MGALRFVFEAIFGTDLRYMPDGGLLTRCPCGTHFSMPEHVVRDLMGLPRGEAYDLLRADPLAVCPVCRDLYGSYNGIAKAQDVASRARRGEENDGLYMRGAE